MRPGEKLTQEELKLSAKDFAEVNAGKWFYYDGKAYKLTGYHLTWPYGEGAVLLSRVDGDDATSSGFIGVRNLVPRHGKAIVINNIDTRAILEPEDDDYVGPKKIEDLSKETKVMGAEASRTLDPVTNKLYRFVKEKNKITNSFGWRPLEIPSFDPVAPAMVLHDLLEHFPEDDGSLVSSELMAIGAAHYLREEGGYFRHGIRNELVEPAFKMLFTHMIQDKRLLDVTSIPSTPQDMKDHRIIEATINQTIANSTNYLVHNFSYSEIELILSTYDITMVKKWMIKGYFRAKKRFTGLDQLRLVKLYNNAQKLLEDHLSAAKPGDIVNLTLNVEEYSAEIALNQKVTG